MSYPWKKEGVQEGGDTCTRKGMRSATEEHFGYKLPRGRYSQAYLMDIYHGKKKIYFKEQLKISKINKVSGILIRIEFK